MELPVQAARNEHLLVRITGWEFHSRTKPEKCKNRRGEPFFGIRLNESGLAGDHFFTDPSHWLEKGRPARLNGH